MDAICKAVLSSTMLAFTLRRRFCGEQMLDELCELSEAALTEERGQLTAHNNRILDERNRAWDEFMAARSDFARCVNEALDDQSFWTGQFFAPDERQEEYWRQMIMWDHDNPAPDVSVSGLLLLLPQPEEVKSADGKTTHRVYPRHAHVLRTIGLLKTAE